MSLRTGVPRRRASRSLGWTVLLSAIVLGTGTGTARAELPGDVPDKIRISLGGIAADTYTDAALGSTTAGVGATINFEDIFNLPESKDTWRVELNWRIGKRQFLDFGYFELNRSGSRILQDDVEWGDFIFQANGQVTAGFDTNFPYAAWRYAFLDLPQVRISGSAGFNYLSIGATLEASGNVTDMNGVPVGGEVSEEAKVAAPVPQLGLQIDWALSKRLAVLMYTRQIYVNFSGINGGIGETAARLQWWYAKHAGISGGLDKESIDLKSYETGDTRARFRYEVRGWSFYLNFAF
ncbi:MAG TPA: hypothetical protein VFQ07_13180 [Candidatus Polarisedimenticolia bacterium]|nr:hypothetical protein [Candidatus Polarisedimenticolia bacterium]